MYILELKNNENHSIQTDFIISTFNQREILHNGLKQSDNSIKLSVPFSAEIWNFVNANKLIKAKITKDGETYFTGYIRPDLEFSKIQRFQPIQLELVSASYILSFFEIKESIAFKDTTLGTVVSSLLERAEIIGQDTSFLDEPIIFDIIEEKTTVKDALSQILFEYGYFYDFDKNGEFTVQKIYNKNVTPSVILDGTNILEKVQVSKKEEEFDRIEVEYDLYKKFENILIFQDNTGSSVKKGCFIELGPGEYLGQIEGETSYDITYDSDKGKVIWVDDASLSILSNSGKIQSTFTNKNTKGNLSIYNPTNKTDYILMLEVWGTAYINTVESATIKVGQEGKSKTIKSKYIHSKEAAKNFAKMYYDWGKSCDYVISLQSKLNLDVGTIVEVNTAGKIVGRVIEKNTKLDGKPYSYKIEAIEEYELPQITSSILRKSSPIGTAARGTGILKIDTAPTAYTTPVAGITPVYRISKDTVKSQSKVDDVYTGDILQYSYYQYQVILVADDYVYTAERTSIRGSAGATGATGAKGDTGATGAKGDTGASVNTNLQSGNKDAAGCYGYSAFANGVFERSNYTTIENYIFMAETTNLVSAGKQYTISFEAKQNGNLSSAEVFYFGNNYSTTGYITSMPFSPTTTWQKFTHTFTIPDGKILEHQVIRFDNNGTKTDGEVAILYIRNVKLEEGGIATPFCYSVKDSIGAKGDTGPIGPKGDKGENGTSVKILGTKPSASDLPATGEIGDSWLVNGNLYVWTDGSWENVGNIQGPKGDTGKDATQYYIHYVYCDDKDLGTNYSTTDTRKYVGVYVDTTSADATSFAKVPSDVVWSQIEGATGARGSLEFSGTEIYSFSNLTEEAYTITTASTGITYSTMPILVGDTYINTTTQDVWICSTSGTPTTAKWKYQGRRCSDKDDSNRFRLFSPATDNGSTPGTITKSVVKGENPFGKIDDLLKITNTNGPANTRYVPYNVNTKIDPKKTYRHVTYIKQEDANYIDYIGIAGWEPENSFCLSLSGGTLNGGAYFTFSNNFGTLGRWYMVVGYIVANGTTTAPADSGVYDMVTKQKVSDVANFQWKPNVTYCNNSGCLIRYAQNASTKTSTAYLYDVRLDEVNGTEPTLNELLNLDTTTKSKGAWKASTVYNVGDIVYLNGNSYICTANHTSDTSFDSGRWNIIASKGDKGDTGASVNTNLQSGNKDAAGCYGYSKFDNGVFEISNSTQTENYIFMANTADLVSAGKQYTISFEAKQNGNVASAEVFYFGSDYQNTGYITSRIFSPTTTWQKFTHTFTITEGKTLANQRIRFDNNGTKTDGTNAILYIRNVKLEEGDIATPFCYSVKDSIGATGQRGGRDLAITTAPGAYTTAIGGFTPSYRIALSTVKTQSGISAVYAGDTLVYGVYRYPVGYVDASYVYTASRTSVKGDTGTKTFYSDISRTWTNEQWNSYSAVGYTTTWSNSTTDGMRVGDTLVITATLSEKGNSKGQIFTEITGINSSNNIISSKTVASLIGERGATGASSRTIAYRINYSNFSTANDGEMYVCGYNSDGAQADIPGYVIVNGAIHFIKGMFNSNVPMNGYVAAETGGTIDSPKRPFYVIFDWWSGKYYKIENDLEISGKTWSELFTEITNKSNYIVLGKVSSLGLETALKFEETTPCLLSSTTEDETNFSYQGVVATTTDMNTSITPYKFTQDENEKWIKEALNVKYVRKWAFVFCMNATTPNSSTAEPVIKLFNGTWWSTVSTTDSYYNSLQSLMAGDLPAIAGYYDTLGLAVPAICGTYIKTLTSNKAFINELFANNIVVRNKIRSFNNKFIIDKDGNAKLKSGTIGGISINSTGISTPFTPSKSLRNYVEYAAPGKNNWTTNLSSVYNKNASDGEVIYKIRFGYKVPDSSTKIQAAEFSVTKGVSSAFYAFSTVDSPYTVPSEWTKITNIYFPTVTNTSQSHKWLFIKQQIYSDSNSPTIYTVPCYTTSTRSDGFEINSNGSAIFTGKTRFEGGIGIVCDAKDVVKNSSDGLATIAYHFPMDFKIYDVILFLEPATSQGGTRLLYRFTCVQYENFGTPAVNVYTIYDNTASYELVIQASVEDDNVGYNSDQLPNGYIDTTHSWLPKVVIKQKTPNYPIAAVKGVIIPYME